MTDDRGEARELFRQAQARHAAHDLAGSIELATRALELDPGHTGALEHLGMVCVTRRRRFDEGLELLQRAVDLRPDDAGLWYSLGWCCEFAAQATGRSPTGDATVAQTLYRRAADAFRRCLALRPEAKLADDANDLLEIVEDRLSQA